MDNAERDFRGEQAREMARINALRLITPAGSVGAPINIEPFVNEHAGTEEQLAILREKLVACDGCDELFPVKNRHELYVHVLGMSNSGTVEQRFCSEACRSTWWATYPRPACVTNPTRWEQWKRRLMVWLEGSRFALVRSAARWFLDRMRVTALDHDQPFTCVVVIHQGLEGLFRATRQNELMLHKIARDATGLVPLMERISPNYAYEAIQEAWHFSGPAEFLRWWAGEVVGVRVDPRAGQEIPVESKSA